MPIVIFSLRGEKGKIGSLYLFFITINFKTNNRFKMNLFDMSTRFLEEFEGIKIDARKSLKKHQQAIELDPNNAGPFNGIGGVYAKLGNFKKAIQYYKKAIKIDPNNAGPFNGIGGAYFGLEKFDQAIIYYKKAIKINPDNASTWYYLGAAYLVLNKNEDALVVFTDALKIHKENPFILNGLGVTCSKLNNVKKPVTRLAPTTIKKSLKP